MPATSQMRPLVSVVVPIYKVERYLPQCVESLLAQTLRDIEIILVDDGSPDACPELVDEYAARDARVVALHQPNGGYGRAVNHGISRARGEYIGIIEADDWIEPDMYMLLYVHAERNRADMVKCSFWRYDSTRPYARQDAEEYAHYRILDKAPRGAFCVAEYPELLLAHPAIWAGLYRADSLREQRFSESGSASYQDFPFMVEALCRAERIAVLPRYLVHYRVEAAQGSSTTDSGRRLLMMPTQCAAAADILRQYGRHEELAEEFYHHAFKACLGFYQQIEHEYKAEYFERMEVALAGILNVPGFSFRHFRGRERRACKLILREGTLRRQRLNLMLKARDFLKSLCSLHIGRNGFRLQFLGIMIATPRYHNSPALFKIRLK